MKGRIVLVLCLLLLVSGGIAGYNEKNASQLSTQPVITVEALKGETVTDLLIHVPPGVTIAKKIQVKAYYANGTHKFTRNFFDKTALNGIILIQFDDLMRGERVDVRLRIEKEKDDEDAEIEQKRTDKKEDKDEEGKESDTLKGSTVVLLRPDLAFYSVNVAGKVLVGGTLSVNATIQELNGDRGAEAVVSLMDGGTVLDTRNVNLSAGGMTSVILSTTFKSGNLSVKISNAVPAEYNDTNNIYPLVVSAVSPDLAVSNVSAPAQVRIGERFEVLASISELYGEIGANATVALVDNGTLLGSRMLYVPAGSSVVVSFNASLDVMGNHNLTVQISSSVPSDSFAGNNMLRFEIIVVQPPPGAPAIIGSAPTSPVSNLVGKTQTFNITANQTVDVTWLINGTSVQTNTSVTDASYTNTSASVGIWNVTAVALNTNGTASQIWNWNVTSPPESEHMFFSSKYYYQNTSLNDSHYITAAGHIDNSQELLLKEDEVISFTASSNRTLSFPIDRVYLNITNEAGEGFAYVETAVRPTDGNIFTKYYPDLNSVLTLRIDGNGTSVSVESKANSSTKYSSGYLYWWFKGAQEWNVTTNSSEGRLLRSTGSLRVRVELVDGQWLLGGSAITPVSSKSYIGGGIDTTEGQFMEQRSVWIYSGAGSGNTVT